MTAWNILQKSSGMLLLNIFTVEFTILKASTVVLFNTALASSVLWAMQQNTSNWLPVSSSPANTAKVTPQEQTILSCRGPQNGPLDR